MSCPAGPPIGRSGATPGAAPYFRIDSAPVGGRVSPSDACGGVNYPACGSDSWLEEGVSFSNLETDSLVDGSSRCPPTTARFSRVGTAGPKNGPFGLWNCRAPARWDHPSASDMGPALGVINVGDGGTTMDGRARHAGGGGRRGSSTSPCPRPAPTLRRPPGRCSPRSRR